MTEVAGNGAPAAAAAEPSPFGRGPDPRFEVLGAEPVERAAAPTLRFRLRATDESGRRVFTIALSVLITLEPSKRAYDPDSRDRLVELFGEPERWAATTSSIRWAQVDSLVPGFEGATEFDLPIACSYDLELAASKYLYGLADGDAPLRFHFNGTVFYEADAGRMQVVQVPWDCNARYRMPDAAWRRAIEAHYPHLTGVPVHAETLRDNYEQQVVPVSVGACRATTPSSTSCSGGRAGDERGGRPSRLLAALRGLRALPLHARGHEERDADAVRDRLPAGLRRPP